MDPLRHVPAAVALGAVLLYALGIVATMGALRAAGLDVGQAFAHIPLEIHLRNGVAQLARPMFWVTVGLVALLGWFASAAGRYFPTSDHECVNKEPLAVDATATDKHQGEVSEESARWHRVASRMKKEWALWAGFGLFAFIVATQPWPDAIGAALAGSTLFALPVLNRLVPDEKALLRLRILLIYGGTLIVVLAAGQAFYRSDPLPTALVTTSQETVGAAVIASDGGFLLLGPDIRKKDQLYRAIPTNRVVRFSTVKRERKRDEPSLANLVGIHWR